MDFPFVAPDATSGEAVRRLQEEANPNHRVRVVRTGDGSMEANEEDRVSLTEPFTARGEGSGPWQVLADGSRTDGAVLFGEARLPPMTPGPSLHVHAHEDEAVYVIQGVMTFRIGEETLDAEWGTLVWLPRRVPHTFANLTDQPVWAFGTTVPAGLEGMFAEQAAYFASLSGPPDEHVIDEIGARYGVRRVGPPLGSRAAT